VISVNFTSHAHPLIFCKEATLTFNSPRTVGPEMLVKLSVRLVETIERTAVQGRPELPVLLYIQYRNNLCVRRSSPNLLWSNIGASNLSHHIYWPSRPHGELESWVYTDRTAPTPIGGVT
jgi:hypothetical protein